MVKNDTLEGLRGLAAMIVLCTHVLSLFYPATQNALCPDCGGQAHHAAEAWIATSPLSLLFNGQFAVCLFFVISGYALSLSYIRSGQAADLRALALRRFPRLGIPVFAAVMLVWVCLEFNLFHHQALQSVTLSGGWLAEQFTLQPDLPDAFRKGFYEVLLLGDRSYNQVLWTLRPEFYGALLLALTLWLGLRWWVVAAVAALVSATLSFYAMCFYLMFMAGAALAGVSHTNAQNHAQRARLSLVAGLAIAACYVRLDPWLATQAWITDWLGLNSIMTRAAFVYVLAAPLTIYGALFWPPAAHGLASQSLVRLGQYSFSIYLLHLPLLCSFTAWLFTRMTPVLPYDAAVVASLMATAPLLWICAALFHWLVDAPARALARKISRFLSEHNRYH